ncbi:MAG TPA: RNA polymerase sigma factor [Pyrinomonadaceae bacterium]|jgi:RNA polymerase sigma-70 factor (ECF subfamily)
MIDDAAAIERCLNGEKEAFRFLVERYQAQAVAHAASILVDREDARDAAQEAFVDAFQALGKFDLRRRFYPWFYVLLRNRCYKLTAKKRDAESLEDAEILAAPGVGMTGEEKIALERALLSIASEDREIVTLKYLDGFSYDEIAELLRIPRGTVMSRLFYARRALQAKLTRKFH